MTHHESHTQTLETVWVDGKPYQPGQLISTEDIGDSAAVIRFGK